MTFNPQLKPRRVEDEKYREWVKTWPCLLSSVNCRMPIDPHHVPKKGLKGTGTKVSDYRCVPLCRFHHNAVGTFQLNYREQFEAEILRLNRLYRAEHPLSLKKARRVKKDPLYVVHQSVCGQRHTIREGFFYCPKVRLTVKVF